MNDPVENATWVYSYDRGGNILNKKKYAYTTGTVGTVQQTITYTYNSAWKDKLATYNGTTLSYDAIGNLTGDGTWTYTWAGGRQLSGMSKSGTAITYAYNNSGLRVRKTVAGVAINYTLNGNIITHLTKGSDWMHFFYDAQSKPSLVNYKGATYRYLYNLQGDVIGLVDASGNVMVEYKYDAWGKIIGRTGSLASTLGYLNPFRYRGYVYDEETGLYYLRSRYYNPEWGRFINADVILGRTGEVLSHNLFGYCKNVPVGRIDPYGYCSLCAWIGERGPYNSEEAAAIAFCEEYYSASQYVYYEFATRIYSKEVDGETKYFYKDILVLGAHGGSVPEHIMEGTQYVAMVHTHTLYNGRSDDDGKYVEAYWDNKYPLAGYVIGPDGKLQRYYGEDSIDGFFTASVVPNILTEEQRICLEKRFRYARLGHIMECNKEACINRPWR